MIGLDGEKMSKSRGNLVFVSRLRADGVDPNAVRLALLAGHYRSDRQWTDDLLTAAQQRLARWREAAALHAAPSAADLVAAAARPPGRRSRHPRRARGRRRVGGEALGARGTDRDGPRSSARPSTRCWAWRSPVTATYFSPRGA